MIQAISKYFLFELFMQNTLNHYHLSCNTFDFLNKSQHYYKNKNIY